MVHVVCYSNIEIQPQDIIEVPTEQLRVIVVHHRIIPSNDTVHHHIHGLIHSHILSNEHILINQGTHGGVRHIMVDIHKGIQLKGIQVPARIRMDIHCTIGGISNPLLIDNTDGVQTR